MVLVRTHHSKIQPLTSGDNIEEGLRLGSKIGSQSVQASSEVAPSVSSWSSSNFSACSLPNSEVRTKLCREI